MKTRYVLMIWSLVTILLLSVINLQIRVKQLEQRELKMITALEIMNQTDREIVNTIGGMK